jgi:hypothetical protein
MAGDDDSQQQDISQTLYGRLCLADERSVSGRTRGHQWAE